VRAAVLFCYHMLFAAESYCFVFVFMWQCVQCFAVKVRKLRDYVHESLILRNKGLPLI